MRAELKCVSSSCRKKYSSHFTDNLQLLIREEVQKYRVMNGVWFGICSHTVEWQDVCWCQILDEEDQNYRGISSNWQIIKNKEHMANSIHKCTIFKRLATNCIHKVSIYNSQLWLLHRYNVRETLGVVGGFYFTAATWFPQTVCRLGAKLGQTPM